MQLHLLQAALSFRDFKPALYAYATAFVITLLLIPFIIRFVNHYKIYDHPGERKIHISSIPTMGGIAIFAGLIITMLIWVNIARYEAAAAFFLSVCIILGIGILDDLKNLPARYKISIETALAVIIALSGIRITEMNGLFGLHHLPLAGQYLLTVVAIVGVINAFNLIDGIDGLAGGLGFMSLITLGIFLFFSKEFNYGLIAFAMAGAVLGFLYYNFNPAKIFMGDTGSLILGFVIAVLCIQLIRINSATPHPVVPHIRIFTLGIVFIPVFDSVRMFTMRLWYGRSPFSADKNHIHHLLTQNGFSHGFTTGALLGVNAVLLLFLYWLRKLNPEIMLGIMILYMLGVLYLFRKSYLLKKVFPRNFVKKTVAEQQEKAQFKSR